MQKAHDAHDVGRRTAHLDAACDTTASGILHFPQRDISNIILIGMPGAGKSTLGVVVAKILNKGFLDCDLVIQQHFGKTLQQLIDEQGSEGFIASEGRVLADIKATDCVIATGGSAVYSPAAMHHLAQRGVVVYVRVTLESLVARLGDLRERGVVARHTLTGDVCDSGASDAHTSDAYVSGAHASDAYTSEVHAGGAHASGVHTGGAHADNHKVLEELYHERYHLYERFADIVVDVDGLSISDAALKMAAALEDYQIRGHEECK